MSKHGLAERRQANDEQRPTGRGARFEVRGLRMSFRSRASRSFSLEVERLTVEAGECLAVVGPSGAGKTTLLRALAAASRPSSGSLRMDGRAYDELDAAALRELRASMGFIHQDLGLVPNFRVIQNVVCGRLGRRSFLSSLRSIVSPSRADIDGVHRLLERVGIGDKLYERTERLSGGQRQRVAIARALFQEPRALFADEPVSSVDPARARDTVKLLLEISREQGITMCISLHNLDLAKEFCPRLLGLRNGRVAFDRSSHEVETGEFDALYRLDAQEQ